MKKRPLKERFWEKVIRHTDASKCWEWIAYRTVKGYGVIKTGNYRTDLAHRVSWMLAHGKIPKNKCVLHKCDNPACVNPNHLFIGTKTDNNKDKIKKGRQARGEKHSSARLTEENVLEIRERFKNGEYYKDLANEFGVTPRHIHSIARREKWKHI